MSDLTAPRLDESPAIDSDGGTPAGRQPWWRHGLVLVLLAWVASRLAVLLAFGAAARSVEPVGFPSNLGAWDGAWFGNIVLEGYDIDPRHMEQSNLVFFPLFALVARGVMAITGLEFITAAVLVNFLVGGLFVVLFWALTQRLTNARVAERAAILLCFSPGTVVLSMAYSEGLMLALSAGCLLALTRRRWLIAGLCAALATATRLNAVALCVACAVAAFLAIRRRGEWRAVVAPLLSPLGLVAFFLYLWWFTGDPLAFFAVQDAGWGQQLVPGAQIAKDLWSTVDDPFGEVNRINRMVTLAVLVGGLLALWRWRPRPPAEVLAYTGVSVALTISNNTAPLPRFVLAAFPLVIAYARVFSPSMNAIIVGICAAVSAVLAFIYSNTLLIVP